MVKTITLIRGIFAALLLTVSFATVSYAVAELLVNMARLGKTQEVKEGLAEVANQPFHGSNETKIECAKEGLASMLNFPEKAFKCGPYAVNSLLYARKAPFPGPGVRRSWYGERHKARQAQNSLKSAVQ
ncbi:MAG TPA: hypothetical protein V6D17_04250 [Candidatus Obscuribacterales bacterium]